MADHCTTLLDAPENLERKANSCLHGRGPIVPSKRICGACTLRLQLVAADRHASKTLAARHPGSLAWDDDGYPTLRP
jgi:hypothetical protein